MTDEDLERHTRAIATQIEEEHPDLESELFRFTEGTLSRERASEIDEHLVHCRRCREDVDDARALTPQSRTSRSWIPIAAAIAAIAVTLLLLRTRDAESKRAPVQPTSVKVVPVPPAEPPCFAEAEGETLVRNARAGAPLPLPKILESLRGRAHVLRGHADESSKLEPAGVIVSTPRPELRWPENNGAVAIVTMFEGDREIARSKPLRTNRWRPDRELPRGVVLTWQVELSRGDDILILPVPPTPPARFAITDLAAQAAVEKARIAHVDDPLLLGLLYAKAGLVNEARAAFARVTAAGDVAIAIQLERQLPR